MKVDNSHWGENRVRAVALRTVTALRRRPSEIACRRSAQADLRWDGYGDSQAEARKRIWLHLPAYSEVRSAVPRASGKAFQGDSLSAPSLSNGKAARRRPSRAWVEELQSELQRAEIRALKAERDAAQKIIAKQEEMGKLHILLDGVRVELDKAKVSGFNAERARAEAERLSLDRMRQLGINARGIVSWAELRARTIHPTWQKLNRFQLWQNIIQDPANASLKVCLLEAGWPANQLASNIMGLWASLSQTAHPEVTPRVTQFNEGLVLEVSDAQNAISVQNGRVLCCLADKNYLRVKLLIGKATLAETKGLTDLDKEDEFKAEEAEYWRFLDCPQVAKQEAAKDEREPPEAKA